MADRLKPAILNFLMKKTGRTAKQIRPRLSEIRREYSGLTMNAAAQVYAQSQGTSVMAHLSQEDRQSLATIQAITQVSVSSISKVDRRTVNINNSAIQNLTFGDRNQVSQSVMTLGDLLADMANEIDQSNALSADEKSDYKSDIQAIASQIGKSKPNKTIISAAWDSLKLLADIEGFVQLVGRIVPLIEGFLS